MLDGNIYTILGWTIVIAGGFVVYQYYNGGVNKKGARNLAQKVSQKIPAVTPTDSRPAKAQRKDSKRPAVKSKQSDAPSKATEKKADTSGAQESSAARSSAVEKDTDDTAFAHALAQRRTGVATKSTKTEAKREKTVKQSAANKQAELSATSSTAADAEDNTSPVLSPQPQNDTPSGRDVSDMLEAPQAGPSVLRLTEPEFQKPARQPKQQKPAQEPESKKARQNRKKKEDAARVRQEQEQERRVLMEKQMRTARESRGEAAKNGVPVAVQPNNVWPTGQQAVPVTASIVPDAPLLDTFSADNVSTSSSVAPETPASASVNGVNGIQYSLPDEDEQMRQLIEQDDSAWTSVPSKKSKKADQSAQTGAVQPPTAPSKKSNIVNNNSLLQHLSDDVEA